MFFAAVVAATSLPTAVLSAQDSYTWDSSGVASSVVAGTDGSGVWSTTNSNWFSSTIGHDVAWPTSDSLDTATFGSADNRGGTVSVSGNISAGGIVFDNLDPAGFTIAGVGNASVMIYGGGITVQGAAGSEVFAGSIGIGLATSQNWTNKSTASLLSVYGNISSAVPGTQNLTFSGPGNATIDGVISGSIELNQSGSGTTTLAGNNSFGNATTGSIVAITGGTLEVSADSNLGTAPTGPQLASIVLNGGTLAVNGTFTLSQNRGISIGASSGTISAGSGDTLTYSGAITGSGGLTTQGAGTIVLSGARTYSGPTNVDGGTLTLSGSNPSGGPLTVANESTVNLNYATNNGAKMAVGTLTLGGMLNLTLNSAGTNQTLASSVNLVADTTSQISIPNGTSASNFTLTTGSGTISRASGSVINFNIGQNATLTVATESPGTLQNDSTGVIGGWATVNGTAWASVGANGSIVPFSGPTFVANTWAPGNNTYISGDVNVPANSTTNSLVVGGQSITWLTNTNTIANGGILVANNGTGYSGQIVSPSSNGSCALTSGNGTDLILNDYYTLAPFALDASVVNNGASPIGFVKSGPGTVQFGLGAPVPLANTYTGPTVISGGTLVLYSSLPATSDVTIAAGASMEMTSDASTTFASLAGGGTVTGYPGDQFILTVGGDNTSTTFSGTISEGTYPTSPTGVIKTGTGTWIVSGQNTYTLGTSVEEGTLRLGGNGTLGSTSGGLNVSGTLDLDGVNLGVGLLAGGSGGLIVNNASGTTVILTVGNGNATGYGFAGLIADHSTGTGVLSLVKAGTGTETLAGADTYTGGTTIAAGTLVLNGAGGSLAAESALNFTGSATFDYQGAMAGSSQALGVLTLANGDVTIQSTAGTSGTTSLGFSSLSRAVGATATFLVSGGTNGSTNEITLASAVPNSFISQGAFASIGSGDNYAWNDAGGYVRAINYLRDSGAVYSAGATSVAGSYVQTSGSITAQASGILATLNINAPNTADGTLNLASGATLTLAGVLKTGGGGLYDGAVILGGAAIQPSLNAEFVARVDQSSDSLTIDTPIVANGTNSLTVSGAGTLILGGANTYRGGTFVNGASLELANVNAIQSSTVSLNGSGNLLFAPSIGTFNAGGLAGSKNLPLVDTAGNPVILQVGADNDSTTYSGTINGAGGLSKTGTGTLSLAGANTYTGTTVVNNGTLQLSSASAVQDSTVLLLSSSNLTFAREVGTFQVGGLGGSTNVALNDLAGNPVALQVGNNNSSETYSGMLSGGGSLTKLGTGVLTLTAANSYTGGTNIDGGTLDINSDAALGTAPATPTVNISVDGSAVLQFAANFTSTPLNSNRTISTADSGSVITFDTQSFTVDWGGLFSSNGSMRKYGSGTLNLTGVNPFSADIIVAQGTLVANGIAGNSNSNITITFSDTATFVYQANASGSSEKLYGVSLTAGDATVESEYGASGNAGISFSNPTVPPAGTTLDYVASAGANGSTNKISMAGLTANAFISQGTFFGSVSTGDNYAWYDAGGFVRAINYGSDTGAVSSAGGTSVAGTYVQTTGAISAETTNTFTTLNINSATAAAGAFTLANGATLTVNGILKTGGGGSANAAAIGGGNGIRAASGSQMVLRTDQSTDGLVIATPILANGSSSLLVSGPGTTMLGAANTYSGGTTLNAGTLRMSGAGTLGTPSGSLTVNAGTLDLNGTSQSVGTLTGTQGVILNGAPSTTATLSVGSGNGSGTYAGLIADNTSGGDTVALVKTGNGTQTLTGANTYSGGTTISGGILSVGMISDTGPSNIGDSSGGSNNILNFAGGMLDYNGPIATSIRNVVLTGNGAVQVTNLTIGGTVSGIGRFAAEGGTITFTAANTYSGGTEVTSSMFVADGPASSVASSTGTGNVTVTGGVLTGNGSVLSLNSSGLSVTISNGGMIEGTSGATLTINGPLDFNYSSASVSSTFNLTAAGVNNSSALVATDGINLTGFETNSVYISGTVADGIYDLFNFPAGTGPMASKFTLQTSAPTGQAWSLVNNSSSNSTQIDLVVGDAASSQSSIASSSNTPGAFGPPVEWSIVKSGSYANLQSSAVESSGSGGGQLLNDIHGNPLTATIALGTNSGTFAGISAEVVMSWRAPTIPESASLISDVLNLTGMGSATGEPVQTDPFALEMEYNPARFTNEAASAKAKLIYLAWLNPNIGGGTWQNAVTGDFAGSGIGTQFIPTAMTDYQGSFATFEGQYGISSSNLAGYVGAWGVDTTNHDVWAIINHNSDFAVVPEPATLTLATLAALAAATAAAFRQRGRKHRFPECSPKSC